MEEQIVMAIDGQARLNKKKDELTEELRRLEEEVRDIRRESGPVKMSKAEREKEANQAYYEEMRKKLKDFMGHL